MEKKINQSRNFFFLTILFGLLKQKKEKKHQIFWKRNDRIDYVQLHFIHNLIKSNCKHILILYPLFVYFHIHLVILMKNL